MGTLVSPIWRQEGAQLARVTSVTTGGLLKVGVVLPPEQVDRLDQLAAERQVSRSDMLRTVIRFGLERVDQLSADQRLVA